MTPIETVQALVDALYTAGNWLGWYRDRSPADTDDDRMSALIDAAFAAGSALLDQMQAAPPECQTEAEKTAYAFGWWRAMEAMTRENGRLRAAIQQTLDENGHLADGDVCTLRVLKDALSGGVQVAEPFIEQITPENRHSAALEDGRVVEPLTDAARDVLAERQRAYLAENMKASGISEIKGEGFAVKLYPDRDESVEIEEGATFPADLCAEPKPPAPSKTKIKAAILAGQPVAGARIVRRDRLTIR